MPSADQRYHHGDLRRAALGAAAALVASGGPSACTVREVARRLDVSHAAVTHHFGDKRGIFTALATEGFERLAATLAGHRGDFLELGVAYVRFAVGNPAHFAVMFEPSLLHADDAALATARSATTAMLHGGARSLAGGAGTASVAIAGWALVHGLATLHLAGALPAGLGEDPEAITRAVAAELGRGRRR
jgi:AcrR family transcriptional regulator